MNLILHVFFLAELAVKKGRYLWRSLRAPCKYVDSFGLVTLKK
jgi:hypothetical protein